MATTASPLSSRISTNYSSISSLNALNNQSRLRISPNHQPTTSFRRISLVVQASKPPTEEVNAAIVEVTVDPQDLKYLLKIGAGSIAGAAAIKCGSVIFPDLTQPNIVQALVMIFAPTIVAIVLLVKQSRAE